MEILSTIFNVAFFIFIVVIIGYLKSYYNKLSELDATQKKIGDITKIVEEIKSEVGKKSELFKSELEIKKNKKINLFLEEKNTIVEIYERMVAWRDYLLNEDYYDNLIANKEKILQYKLIIDDARRNIVLYTNRVNLFINSQEIKVALINLTRLYDDFDIKLLSPYMMEWQRIHNLDNPYDIESENIKLLIDDFMKKREKFLTDTNQYYYNFIDLCKKRLDDLTSE